MNEAQKIDPDVVPAITEVSPADAAEVAEVREKIVKGATGAIAEKMDNLGAASEVPSQWSALDPYKD